MVATVKGASQIVAPDFGREDTDRGPAVVGVLTDHLMLRQFDMHPQLNPGFCNAL